MNESFLKRCTTQPKKWELIYWWTLRGLMIFGIIYRLIKPDAQPGQFLYYNSLQMTANLVGMFAWEIGQTTSKKRFIRYFAPSMQDITILGFFLASFGGAFLNFYYIIPHYDKILHLTGCIEAVYVGYEMITAMQLRDKVVIAPKYVALAAFGIAFVFAAGWELFEFTTDQYFGFDAQHWNWQRTMDAAGIQSFEDIPILFKWSTPKNFPDLETQKQRFAIMDTMGDAVLNALGAVPMYLILRKFPFHHRGKNNVNERIAAELAAAKEAETPETVAAD